MTRTEAIARINAQLSSLDDERVLAVADIVEDIAATDDQLRPLTPRELALIEQSREDFKAGRTLTIDEARALSDQFIDSLRQKYPNAP
jgi:hypothetical protein